MKCWEFMGCEESVRKVCPAYPAHGQECWKLPNTIAGGGHLDLETPEAKAVYCKEFCGFFKIQTSAHRPSPGV